MARPNLEDKEARRIYRRELGAVGRRYSLAGLFLILVGAMLTAARVYGWFGYDQPSPDLIALGAFTGGWGLMVWAFFKRNMHHRARMSEPEE